MELENYTYWERKVSWSLTLQTDISPVFDLFIFFIFFFTSGANLSWLKQHLGPSITSEWKVINDRLWMLIPYLPPPADMIIRLISAPPARRKYWFHFVKDFTKFRPNPVYPSEGEIPVLYIPGLNLTSLSPRSLPRACRREGDKTGNFLPGSSCFSNPPPAEGETAVIMFHQRRGLTPLSWSRFLYLNPPVGQTCASVRRKRRHVRDTDAPEWRWRS